MREFILVTGIVLSQAPVGEYDRRVCLLTLERGKISAFAKGARRQGSRLAASTSPFSYGSFRLYEGKSSYTIIEADIQNYFEQLRSDYIGACYGMYFVELADFYARENNDERKLLGLLYQSMKALCAPSLPRRLVKCVYEIKSVAVNGEYPGIPKDRNFEGSTVYTLNYIAESPIEKLYTFTVTDSVLAELEEIAGDYMQTFVDREMKSLKVLQTLC